MVEATGLAVGILILGIFLVYQFFSTIASFILGFIFNKVVLYLGILAFVLYVIVPESVIPYYTIIWDWFSSSINGLFQTGVDLFKEILKDLF